MSKAKLIAWAGPLTIVVGALWLLSALGQLAFQTGLTNSEGLLGLVILPVFLSVVPQLFAVLGTRLRFLPFAGGLGRFGLALSLAGCVGWIVSVLLLILLGLTTTAIGPWGWVSYAPLASVLSIRLGYILFGVEALRSKLLPRWNLLPLLVGLTVVLSLPMEWFGAPALLPTQWALPFLHFAFTGACWVLLGVAMLDQSRAPQPATAL